MAARRRYTAPLSANAGPCPVIGCGTKTRRAQGVGIQPIGQHTKRQTALRIAPGHLPAHALVCERHVGMGISAEEIEASGLPLVVRDCLPTTVEEEIICLADKFYSKGNLEGESTLDDIRKKAARWGDRSAATLEEFIVKYNLA